MEEKILIQYRCADDENFKRLNQLTIIPIVLGFAIIALGFTMITSNEGLSILCSAIGGVLGFSGAMVNAVMKEHSLSYILQTEKQRAREGIPALLRPPAPAGRAAVIMMGTWV